MSGRPLAPTPGPTSPRSLHPRGSGSSAGRRGTVPFVSAEATGPIDQPDRNKRGAGQGDASAAAGNGAADRGNANAATSNADGGTADAAAGEADGGTADAAAGEAGGGIAEAGDGGGSGSLT
jgi:hypothetical protein